MNHGTLWVALGGALAGAAAATLDAQLGAPHALAGLPAPLGLFTLPLVGGVMGLLVGLLAGLAQPERTLRARAQAVRAALSLRGDGDRALATRMALTAGLWVAVAAAWWGLPLLAAGNARVLAAVQRPLFAGAAVALLSLGLALGVLLLAVPARAALAQGLAAAVRRLPARPGLALWALCHPALHLASAAAWALREGAAVEGAPLTARVALLLAVATLLAPLPLLLVAGPRRSTPAPRAEATPTEPAPGDTEAAAPQA